MPKKKLKTEKDINIHRTAGEGRTHYNLTKVEREALSNQLLIERVVAMFLDLEQDRTWPQIADEAGIGLSELKRLVKDPAFMQIYEHATTNLGHDPRLRAVTTALPDLLPLAYRELRGLLTSENQTVRLNAVKEVLRLNSVGDEKNTDDPRELGMFLQQNGVTIEGDMVVQLGIPEEFKEAFRKFLGTNNNPGGSDAVSVVDAEIVRSTDSEPHTGVEQTLSLEPPVSEAPAA